MPTADQNIYVRRSSDHVTVWSGKTLRNTDNYPLTTQGQALFEAAVLAGNHSGITASNGGTVAAGVAPTLTIPNPPVQGYAAYDVKIQAETAASNVNFSGTPGAITRTLRLRVCRFRTAITRLSYGLKLRRVQIRPSLI